MPIYVAQDSKKHHNGVIVYSNGKKNG